MCIWGVWLTMVEDSRLGGLMFTRGLLFGWTYASIVKRGVCVCSEDAPKWPRKRRVLKKKSPRPSRRPFSARHYKQFFRAASYFEYLNGGLGITGGSTAGRENVLDLGIDLPGDLDMTLSFRVGKSTKPSVDVEYIDPVLVLVCKCCFMFGVAATAARSLGPIVLYIKY